MRELGHPLSDDEAAKLFRAMDLDGNGEIDFEVREKDTPRTENVVFVCL